MLNEVQWQNGGQVTKVGSTTSKSPVTKYTRRAMVSVNYTSPETVFGNSCGALSNTLNIKAALFGFDYWKNYDFSCWVQAGANNKFGIVWRSETGNIEGWNSALTANSANKHRGRHYELIVDPVNEKYLVEYHTSWDSGEDIVTTIYSETHESLDYDKWYLLGVITIGSYHFCFVNGHLITYFRDTNCKGGRAGVVFQNTANKAIFLDNVQVREIPASILVLDESYSEPQGEIVKTRETTFGQIAYCEDQQIAYKTGSGGSNCILHLRFDQPYGEKVFDRSPFNHDARVVSGEWKREGHMRFYAGSDGLIIPYTSDLALDTEGTVIIRLRTHDDAVGDDCIIRRGSTDWCVAIKNTDGKLRSSSREPGSTPYTSAPTTDVPNHKPSSQWKTYVIRWDESIVRWQQFCDGQSSGADPNQSQSSNPVIATTDDMVIGQANVDIEYIVIYNKWIEEPSLPGGISARIVDADSHHEDEVFDIRFTEHNLYNAMREFWNDLLHSESGTVEYINPVDHMRDSKPLLYRRGGCFMGNTSHIQYILPDHLKNRMHVMDWTLEIVFASAAVSPIIATRTLVGIGNNLRTDFPIRVYGQSVSSKYTVRWSSESAATTDVGTVKTYDNDDNHGLQIVHITYRANTRDLRAYFHGELQDKTILTAVPKSVSDYVTIGGNEGVFYRVRLIAKCLRNTEIAELATEYGEKPIQVFDEHEFKGYPELNNGLIVSRPIIDNADLVFGERQMVEVFNNGTFTRLEGRVDSTIKPIEIYNLAREDEGSNASPLGNVNSLRLWDMQPIVTHSSHDEAILQFRIQTKIRNPQLYMSGLHILTEVGIAAGLFAFDTHTKIGTHTLDWELRFRHHEMQTCWREGGHTPDGEDVEDDCRGNFYAATGNSNAFNMDADASIDHLSNFTVLTNVNHGAAYVADRDFTIGLLPEHTDDFIRVEFDASEEKIEQFWFDDLHRTGRKFRVSMAFVPYENSDLFDDPNTSNWSVTNLSQISEGNCFNNLCLKEGDSATVGEAYKVLTLAAGTWQAWWGIFGTPNQSDAPVAMVASDYGSINESGDAPNVRRALVHVNHTSRINFRRIDYSLNDTVKQMFQDMPLVVEGLTSKYIRFELRLDATENNLGSYKFDGLCLIPCYNGADFILDQLYATRALKNIRRYPR